MRGQVTLGKFLWDETLGKLDRYAALSSVDLRKLPFLSTMIQHPEDLLELQRPS